MTGRHTSPPHISGSRSPRLASPRRWACLQALSIADVEFPLRGESYYYLAVTAHGVLMALVFTTFFIMGLGYVFAQESLGRITGRRIRLDRVLARRRRVGDGGGDHPSRPEHRLYTFYPPLQAHPLFYIGATLLVVASWIWGGVMIASYRSWRREHPGVPVALSIHGMLATIIIWYLATAGLAIEVVGMLIPWSLGLVDKIDPLLARTFFWWFGHPLVYFWLLPAYVLWYYVLPQVAGGRLFSDRLAGWSSQALDDQACFGSGWFCLSLPVHFVCVQKYLDVN